MTNLHKRETLNKLQEIKTPFFFYDLSILEETLKEINRCIESFPFKVHYAIKANANEEILEKIREYGIGIDCVSGNEVKKAIQLGF